MTDYEKIHLGQRAAEVLSNEAFKAVLDDAREDAVRGLLDDGTDQREAHIATIRAVEILRQKLQSIRTTGKNAQNKQG